MTRLEDLAQLADVSVATVSRALNNSPVVNNETKRRIWQLAREHNYAFRPNMPVMMNDASATIALVLPTPHGRPARISDPFFLELMGGIGDAARDLGCNFIVSHVAPQGGDDLDTLMNSIRAEGLIFLGQGHLHEHYNHLGKTQKQFVVWGADLPGQQYCSVGSDNDRGGRRAASHLLRLGRRRIAYFGDTSAPEMQQRYKGYCEALETAGIETDPDLVLSTHFDIESAEAAVATMLTSGVSFDAIVAANDLIAVGAIRSILRTGRRVPDDIAVVGYDNIMLARYSSPALTTIDQDMTIAGRLLVAKLLNSDGKTDIPSERLPSNLIVRESCGAA